MTLLGRYKYEDKVSNINCKQDNQVILLNPLGVSKGRYKRMIPYRDENYRPHRLVPLLPWVVVALLAINAMYFVLRVSNPVIIADGWYYLGSFLKHAIDHTLNLSDFFIKRNVDDHAAPLFRLLLLVNYRYFDVDYVLDAVVGCLSAVGCCLIFRIIIFSGSIPRKRLVLSVCWMAVSALMLSLNSIGVWDWPLVSLENLTQLFILSFILATWHAYRTRQQYLLVVATLVLGVTSDDSALVAAMASLIAYVLMLRTNIAGKNYADWKVIVVIGVCIAAVRVGYACIPMGYTSQSQHSLTNVVPLLLEQFKDGGWWQWIFFPLVLPVYYQNPFGQAHVAMWHVTQAIMAALLLAAHIAFWRRALRIKYDIRAFAAVNLMLLTYGWIAGILLWRVSSDGNDYLEQPRYVLYYSGHLIALLLMWASSSTTLERPAPFERALKLWVPVAGSLILLLIQIPQSQDAWHTRPYKWAYYSAMAHQIQALAKDPAHFKDCATIEPVCGAPPTTRAALTGLLKENKLNVFSPKVQKWHPYLVPQG
ncbi:hypothetical protein DWU98_18325 [Dyella monticola]|uniref:Glycosyltransferase RgtA/B/C/D-like domain-containing protein n=1 Tax=Dyella monticola TaxID=1927958 RepID=A0A370WTF5_9GAMM|nr:hypothetical protein [Dyella monticola]RDS79287.1 hypothetical protein DWU98_18325 [Dyella monticola]